MKNGAGLEPLTGAPRRSAGRTPTIFGPMLAAGVITVLAAMASGALGWYPGVMNIVEKIVGTAVILLAVVLFYHQTWQRRLAASALHDAEARIGGIVESAMDAIISVDENQRIVLFNAAAEKVFLWPRGAVLGQPLGMLLPERLRGAHQAHIERFGATGATSRRMGDKTTLVGLRANHEEFLLDASISQHRENGRKLFTVILRDITARAEAEDALARSEARLRGILDSAMDAIITVDENEHIVIFNSAAEAIFGCPRDQALGAPLAWFIPERFRTGHSDHIKRFGETGVSSRRMGAQRIVTGLRRDGVEFPIDASISQMSDGSRRFYTVILRDVTARVRAEEALRRSKDELRALAATGATAREQEKSRIARELHDELAQMLTALRMDLNWVSERMPGREEQLAAKLASMQTLLDGTVAATRRIAAELRPLMLDDLGLIPAAEWLVQNFTRRTGIPCELTVEPPELELQDPHATAIFRILQESLTNVARHAQASLVEVKVNCSDGELMVKVRDNGRGFEPGDPRKPNSFGLVGLRERAYLLEGEVQLDTAPGRGTTIEVRIPRPPAPPAS